MSVVSLRSPATARRASAVYCAVYGSGAPLVMLHGIGSSGVMFQPLIDEFCSGHQVIVPDLRGHGRSRRLPAADSIERLADDVSDVLALLRCGPCTVIGHAEGAAVALQLARQQPAAVDALILLEPRLTIERERAGGVSGMLRALVGSQAVGAPLAASATALLGRFTCREWIGTIRQPVLSVARVDASTAGRALIRQLRRRDDLIIAAGETVLTPPNRRLTAALHTWLGRGTATVPTESSEAR